MPTIRLAVLIVLAFFVFILFKANIFAQESSGNVTANQAGVVPENKQELPAANEEAIDLQADESSDNEPEDIKWVWGEVAAVDPGATNIKVRFLDYETDAETDTVFFADKDTVFENIASIEDIKVGDSAGIDYNVNKDGKNIIKSISIEKLSN